MKNGKRVAEGSPLRTKFIYKLKKEEGIRAANFLLLFSLFFFKKMRINPENIINTENEARMRMRTHSISPSNNNTGSSY
jgi:hypothetical protein